MKLIITFALLLLTSTVMATIGDVKVMPLGNDVELKLEEVTPSRIMPYTFYDQAMESIPAMYPKGQIIAKRRMGQFGEKNKLFYSLVAYTIREETKVVIIGGNIIFEKKAWSYSAQVPLESYSNYLVLILEHIARMAF